MIKINSFKSLFVATLVAMSAASCIEETFPEGSSATKDQTSQNASAVEAAANGIPSQMTQWYYIYGEQTHETDMSWPQFMIAQSEMLGDFTTGQGANTGYDWFTNYNNFTNVGPNTYFSYLPWRTLYKLVKASNDLIGAVSADEEDAEKLQLAGYGYAYRALFYFQLMCLYEPAENIYTDVTKVLGLTVPIVTDKTTYEESIENHRATHEKMVEFILSDLDQAESLIKVKPASILQPSLACVYGLKARVHMWDGGYYQTEKANDPEKATAAYELAADFATKAITAAGGDNAITTQSQWLDPKTGFNTAVASWMWKMKYDAENMANLCNWTGWVSAECDWGYASLTMPSIDRSLYDHIQLTDFRKYAFLDPDRSIYAYESIRGEKWLAGMPDYTSLKFRCGNGDFETYSIGGAVDVPLMRIEEFYFIKAEAIAQTQGVSAGVQVLNDFMKYRDRAYSCEATTLRDFQLENLLQMRVEFWGEGTAFYMAKRIKPGVMQNYAGTNANGDAMKINCAGIKPNWNFVIPNYEFESNPCLEKENNPDPSSVIKGPSPEGQYAPGLVGVAQD